MKILHRQVASIIVLSFFFLAVVNGDADHVIHIDPIGGCIIKIYVWILINLEIQCILSLNR